MHQTKSVFLLNLICFYVNDQTIDLTKYDYNRRLVIILSSPSKGKSLKLEFRLFLSYPLLSNGCLIKLIFNLSTLLSVKWSIVCYVKKICLYPIGKSFKSAS